MQNRKLSQDFNRLSLGLTYIKRVVNSDNYNSLEEKLEVIKTIADDAIYEPLNRVEEDKKQLKLNFGG